MTFAGSVSAEDGAGEIVTINIFGADPVTPVYTASAATDAGGNFTVAIDIAVGTYTAQAGIPEDNTYLAVQSALVPFAVGKLPRTITLAVTPQ